MCVHIKRALSACVVHEIPLISPRVGPFSDLPVPDGAAQLVFTSVAAHWFDPIEDFYREAERALYPGGALALCGYSYPEFETTHENHEKLTDISIQVREARKQFLRPGNKGKNSGRFSMTFGRQKRHVNATSPRRRVHVRKGFSPCVGEEYGISDGCNQYDAQCSIFKPNAPRQCCVVQWMEKQNVKILFVT